MKSSTNRTRKDGGAGASARQTKNKTASAAPPCAIEEDGWHLLVTGCDKTEDGLWASPDGRLFLYDGCLSHRESAREVYFPQARSWFEKYHADDPYIFPPHFPEDSAGERFTTYAFKAMQAHKAVPVVSERPEVDKHPPATVVGDSPIKHDKAGGFLRMEEAVERMMALLSAFALEIMVWNDVPDAWHHGLVSCGYTATADDCAKDLYTDWNKVFGEALDQSEGKDGMPAAVRLRISVAKSVSLLRSMAQSLSIHHGEYDDINPRRNAGLPRYEACGYTELARECIVALESQYKVAFAEWQQFGKSADQRAAA